MRQTIPNTSGIYRIQIGPRTFYWGQSQNLRRRAGEHARSLQAGTHNNRWLQRASRKYGAFCFEVHDLCPVEELDAKEQALLDTWCGVPGCANIAREASAVMRGRTHTEETRAKMRESHTLRWQDPDSRERQRSSGVIQRRAAGISATHGRTAPDITVTWEDGTVLTFKRCREVAEHLGLSRSLISHWVTGRKNPHPRHNIASIERVALS